MKLRTDKRGEELEKTQTKSSRDYQRRQSENSRPGVRLVGLVVKASVSRAQDPEFDSRLRRGDISWSSHLAWEYFLVKSPGVGIFLGQVTWRGDICWSSHLPWGYFWVVTWRWDISWSSHLAWGYFLVKSPGVGIFLGQVTWLLCQASGLMSACCDWVR